MTIDEAIINLSTVCKCLEQDTDPIFVKSIRLGIEALKRVRSYKKVYGSSGYIPMPGETEE